MLSCFKIMQIIRHYRILLFDFAYDILLLDKIQSFFTETVSCFGKFQSRGWWIPFMKIALLGFGVVGRGVYELAAARSDIQVTHVLSRRDLSLPGVVVTNDFQEILLDSSIDTVVEVMGGLHPAWDYVRASIEAGKNVVTANKAMVAEFYDELVALIERHDVKFRCTAAVGGGISWLSELERVRRCESIRMVGGIMNGTCNFILDAMTKGGLTYTEALMQAQQLGYAEANPSADVDGIDTWHKLIISCNVAFGVSLNRHQIPVCGIRNILAEDVAQFHNHGLCCKLAATGLMQGGQFSAYVQPTLYPHSDIEATVPENYNLITFEGNTSGRHSFYGQGAGRYPTAYNVVQDCVDFTQGRGFYAPLHSAEQVCNHQKMRYYVRGAVDSWLESHTSDRWGKAVITQPVSVEDMHAWCAKYPTVFIAALSERKDIPC